MAVIDVNALYKIGVARNARPSMQPQLFPIIGKILGGFAVDLLHDAWEMKKSHLKTFDENAIGVDTPIKDKEGNVLPELNAHMKEQEVNFLSNARDEVEESDWGATFAIKDEKRRKNKSNIRNTGNSVRNYKSQKSIYTIGKANARERVSQSNTNLGAHNEMSTIHFDTMLGTGALDNYMVTTETGDMVLSSELITNRMTEIQNQMLGMNQTTPEYEELRKLNGSLSKLMTNTMDGKDLPLKSFPIGKENESNVILNYRKDSKKLMEKYGKITTTGVFNGTQVQTESQNYWSSALRGDYASEEEKNNWDNKITSMWFQQVDSKTPSPAHNYITGKHYIGGVEMEALPDPFASDADQTDANNDGVIDVLETYMGRMELLKKENLTTGHNLSFLENYFVEEDKKTFKYVSENALYEDPNKNTYKFQGWEKEHISRANSINAIVEKEGAITLKNLQTLTLDSNKSIIEEDGKIIVKDSQGYLLDIIDPKNPMEVRNILYRHGGVDDRFRTKSDIIFDKNDQGSSRINP
tara:strand:+ start:3677 stop:5251 length:1575 start_codon:yes stop_codon:yes gene_type:complete